jgi:hypothetical protein
MFARPVLWQLPVKGKAWTRVDEISWVQPGASMSVSGGKRRTGGSFKGNSVL